MVAQRLNSDLGSHALVGRVGLASNPSACLQSSENSRHGGQVSADASAQLGGVAVPRTLSGRRCGRLRRGAGLDECVREAAPAPITKLLDCHGPQYIDLALTFGLNSGAERREGGREAARSVDSARAPDPIVSGRIDQDTLRGQR